MGKTRVGRVRPGTPPPPRPPSNGSQNTGPVMQTQTDCQTDREVGLGTGGGRQRWEFASEQPLPPSGNRDLLGMPVSVRRDT